MEKQEITPFIKWVGGKSKYIKEILPFVPNQINRYFEPFIGGGALFFHLQPKKAYISDINIELINCYQVIRADIKGLISELDKLIIKPNLLDSNNEEEYFYSLRKQYNQFKKSYPFSYEEIAQGSEEQSNKQFCIQKAGLFIYLNKTCFRGIYRENKSGEMNVPYGNYKKVSIYDKNNLLNISKYLFENDIQIQHHSFDKINPTSTDFVYMDPPYDKEQSTDFTSYTKEEFKQEPLFTFISKLPCPFVLSNSPTSFIKTKYNTFGQKILSGKRSVDIKKVKTVKDIEIIIYPSNLV